MSEHEFIWLEPKCGEENAEGRTWCEHDAWGDCPECGLPSVKYVRADLYDALSARIAELERERDEARREATDQRYMKQAYWYMLMPLGLKVAKMWDDKGVKRVHHSWAPEASKLTGEERAKAILEWEDAARTAVPVESIDGPRARTTLSAIKEAGP